MGCTDPIPHISAMVFTVTVGGFFTIMICFTGAGAGEQIFDTSNDTSYRPGLLNLYDISSAFTAPAVMVKFELVPQFAAV